MFPLIPILVALIIVGAAIAIVQLLPIDATIKRIIHIVIIVAACLWVLSLFSGFSFGPVYRR